MKTKDSLETPTHVGARAFRENLSEYMASETPFAITRHGQTIGYYIPVKPQPQEQERAALGLAARRLHELLEAQGINEDDIIEEFNHLRRRKS